jgi:hypothetical protein
MKHHPMPAGLGIQKSDSRQRSCFNKKLGYAVIVANKPYLRPAMHHDRQLPGQIGASSLAFRKNRLDFGRIRMTFIRVCNLLD